MPVETCSVPDCGYTTNDYPAMQALEALRLHSRGAHPENFNGNGGGGNAGALIDAQRREKPRRPVLHITGGSVEQQDWAYFIQCWDAYETMCGINADNINMFFRDALPEEVTRLLYSTYGSDLAKQKKADLVENTRKLVVPETSKYASIVELEGMRQQHNERSDAFLARLKNKARHIGFEKTVQCSCDPPTNVRVTYCEEMVLSKKQSQTPVTDTIPSQSNPQTGISRPL